ETENYTLDWKTLIYKLTDRNRKIFKEQDKLAEIVDDVNKLQTRVKELPEKEMKFLVNSWSNIYVSRSGNVHVWNHIDRKGAASYSQAQMDYWRDEENRQNNYGPSVRLVPGMTAMVVAGRGTDTTYAVLVTGKQEVEKSSELTTESPGLKREADAARKLKYAK